MGRWVRTLAWSALPLFVAGCATASAPRVVDCSSMRLTAVTRPEERRAFGAAGFMVEFPRGDHWCISRFDAAGVVLGKNPLGGRTLEGPPTLAEQTHTFGAMATTVTLQGATVSSVEDLRTFLDRWQQTGGPQRVEWGNMILGIPVPPGAPPSRFTTISGTFEVVKIQDIDCVLSRQTKEERGNPGLPGRVLILLNRTWYCLNPGSPRVVFIGYSERYLQGYVPQPLLIEALRSEVEPFVQSLRVMAPQ